MIERLQKLLAAGQLDDYAIIQHRKISHQAYFIRQKLDQHRISDATHTDIIVYVDALKGDRKLRGSCKREVYSGDSDEKIMEEIRLAKYYAGMTLNPYFELVANEKYEKMEQYDTLGLMKSAVTSMQSIRNTDTESINSYEVFVNEHQYHFVNSQNTDITFSTIDEECEIIINAVDENHEIELYHDVRFADLPMSYVEEGIYEEFQMAHDRSKAIPTPKMNINVIMGGEDNKSFYEYFADHTNTRSVYMQMSDVQLGTPCQSGEDCDRLTVSVKAFLPGSSRNMPYSIDGNKAKDYDLVKDGVWCNYNGDQATGYYLGLKDIAPAYNLTVSGGSCSETELKKQPYLEILKFSSFQMDDTSGDFGGEIRFGYYFDGEKRVPVTGGSITGNMKNVLDHVRVSTEMKQYNSVLGPKCILLANMEVSGIE